MHVFAILRIQASRRIQLFNKTVFYWEEVKSEIWGSPGSRQLLQLQQFPKIQKNFKWHKKCIWHGNEEQKNSAVYHMLRSCGVQARNYL